MRFLLPTFALYTIAAVWLLKIRSETEPQRAQKWARIVLGVSLVWGLTYSVLVLRHLKQDNQMLAEITLAIEQRVEPGSVLIAQSGLLQHLDFLGDWRLAPEEAFDRRARRPLPMGPHEGPRSDLPPGAVEELSPAERTQSFRHELVRWAGDTRTIYWITTEEKLKTIRDRLEPAKDEFTTIAEVNMSVRPGSSPGFGDGPGGPPPGPGGFFFGFGGPPPGPGGPPFGPGGPGFGGPHHFTPPQDGKLKIVRWTISSLATRHPPLATRRMAS